MIVVSHTSSCALLILVAYLEKVKFYWDQSFHWDVCVYMWAYKCKYRDFLHTWKKIDL